MALDILLMAGITLITVGDIQVLVGIILIMVMDIPVTDGLIQVMATPIILIPIIQAEEALPTLPEQAVIEIILKTKQVRTENQIIPFPEETQRIAEPERVQHLPEEAIMINIKIILQIIRHDQEQTQVQTPTDPKTKAILLQDPTVLMIAEDLPIVAADPHPEVEEEVEDKIIATIY